MRLWHEKLIPVLPRQQLLGQHRECCALRGNGWGKKHSIVNYVFNYSPYRLYLYHQHIMDEMKERGYHVDSLWEDPYYRGKISEPHSSETLYMHDHRYSIHEFPFYPEHNEAYLQTCLENLHEKGIVVDSNE
ncbi:MULTISPECIES: TIGR02328 family protein [Virgibacillus]|uniref:Pyrimidine dimer DNA glycosylase n=2 Tax=Virgibacillus TaxID=84406 RepID=A0A024QE31_9BACI|nr:MULTISPECIES: TIGR02328 family protein [Virgibacillus]EQB36737.1 hypothetical protein M948_17030 [Virgibacillus sp. CM-4]MYL42564.1 hypothetical protein [Virgibacillus massiliensis]GGJ74052.1 hypothetical protein GCM10007111_39630 [Virgibacillus kapii]CDQ40445.1 Pyrimidine dimer DNA glycosylase [Virgibacillus massiliensis]